MLVLAKTQG